MKLSSNIPIPPPRMRWPFRTMPVGYCLEIDDRAEYRLAYANMKWTERHTELKFRAEWDRRTKTGRIWRTK